MFVQSCHIRYSEIDRSGRLSMEGLLRLFQDIGYRHAYERGLGLSFTEKELHTWYLLSWDIRMVEAPLLGQEVHMETFFYELIGPVAHKNILMKDENGKVLAYADTMWVYMDIRTQEPAKVPDGQWPKEDYADSFPVPEKMRRIPNIRENAEGVESLQGLALKDSLLDTNRHANNTKLTLLAMELAGADLGCVHLRAEFKKQVFEKSIMKPCRKTNGKEIILSLKDEQGKDYATFLFEKEEVVQYDFFVK